MKEKFCFDTVGIIHLPFLQKEEEQEEGVMEQRDCWGKFGCVALLTVKRVEEKFNEIQKPCKKKKKKRQLTQNINQESCRKNKDFSLLKAEGHY